MTKRGGVSRAVELLLPVYEQVDMYLSLSITGTTTSKQNTKGYLYIIPTLSFSLILFVCDCLPILWSFNVLSLYLQRSFYPPQWRKCCIQPQPVGGGGVRRVGATDVSVGQGPSGTQAGDPRRLLGASRYPPSL
jgi:hypothetical protein